MRKMATTSLKFHRLDISPYQGDDFAKSEIKLMQDLGVAHTNDPKNAEILITNTHTDFSKLDLKAHLNTELLLHPNSGYDNIPASFVKDAHFSILTGNKIRAHGVSEYILGRLFAHFSTISHQEEWEAGRNWSRERLWDKQVLILGNGLIGGLLFKALTPLVKKLNIYDPFKSNEKLSLKGTDVVLVAASLNPTSHGLINKEFLLQLNENWVLINAARGKIVNQADLVSSLSSNSHAYAYLDVFESEPFKKDAFLALDNLFTTSHLAGVSENLDQLILDFEKEMISKFITHRSNLSEFTQLQRAELLSNKLSPDKSFLI